MRNTNTFFVFATVWTLFITFLSIANVGGLGSAISIAGKDKVVHFLFYFVFVIIWHFAKYDTLQLNKNIVISAIFYGIIMEICQHFFTKNRMADAFDVVANSAGAIAGYQYLKFKLAQKPK